MHRLLRPVLFAAAALSFPAAAQTPPTQGWPANRAPAAPAQPPQAPPAGSRRTRAGSGTPPRTLQSRCRSGSPRSTPRRRARSAGADFLTYRMKTFVELDANKDGKLTLDEFLKVAEPPFTPDGPNMAPLEERRARARTEFQNLDTNRDGFVERGEAEALVHAEFNQYDMDRDNKITEPEVRLVMQGTLRREEQARPPAEQARRRQGTGRDQRVHRHAAAQRRPARQEQRRQGQHSRNTPPSPARPTGRRPRACRRSKCARQIAMRKFAEIDTNKDNMLDRVELTAFAVNQFLRHGPEQGPLPERGRVQEGGRKPSRTRSGRSSRRCSPRNSRAPLRRRHAAPGPAPQPPSRRVSLPACRKARAKLGARHWSGARPAVSYSTVTLLARLRG